MRTRFIVKSCVRKLFIFTEHNIDGETLLLLVDDLDEFSHTITKTVARLKIKKFLKAAKCMVCHLAWLSRL